MKAWGEKKHISVFYVYAFKDDRANKRSTMGGRVLRGKIGANLFKEG